MRLHPLPLAALAALALADVARAQPSTDRLPEADSTPRRPRVEVSAGASVIPIRNIVGLTQASGPEPYAALVAVRWASETRGGVRAMGWWLHRGDRFQAYNGSTGRYESVEATQNVLALAGTFDATWRVGRRATLALAMGAGLASAHGEYPGQTGGEQATGGVSEVGRLITGGLALRIRSLVLEQHGLFLLGAERAVPENREFFPLTVGWRF